MSLGKVWRVISATPGMAGIYIKLVVAGLLLITSPIIFGYGVAAVQALGRGEDTLPPLENYWALWVDGFYWWASLMVFFLPFYALATFSPMFFSNPQQAGASLAALGAVCTLAGVLIDGFLGSAVAIALPQTQSFRGSRSLAVNPLALYKIATAAPGYWKLMGLGLVCALVELVVSVVCGKLGHAFLGNVLWGSAVMGYAFITPLWVLPLFTWTGLYYHQFCMEVPGRAELYDEAEDNRDLFNDLDDPLSSEDDRSTSRNRERFASHIPQPKMWQGDDL